MVLSVVGWVFVCSHRSFLIHYCLESAIIQKVETHCHKLLLASSGISYDSGHFICHSITRTLGFVNFFFAINACILIWFTGTREAIVAILNCTIGASNCSKTLKTQSYTVYHSTFQLLNTTHVLDLFSFITIISRRKLEHSTCSSTCVSTRLCLCVSTRGSARFLTRGLICVSASLR